MASACTPIESPRGAEPPPVQIGERLPSVTWSGGGREAWPLSELTGRPVVLTFVRPYEDARSAPSAEVLARIAAAMQQLRADVASRTEVVVVLLDGAEEPIPPGVAAGWSVVDAPRPELRGFAARLGVLLWDGTADTPGQSFLTVVADGRLHVSARFPGIDGWSAGDLVGAIVAAAER